MSISIVSTAPSGKLSYVPVVESSSGQCFAQTFQQSKNEQQKRQLSKKILDLLDELEAESTEILRQTDMSRFKEYCKMLGSALNEIVENAYLFRTERVLDSGGRQRVFATVTVIDEQLDKLGADLISGNSIQLEFISRIDDIRGLVTDLFS